MTDKLTTPGAIWLKHSMPTKEAKDSFDLYKPLTKGAMSDMIAMLMEKGGPEAFEHINKLGKLFFHKATEIGASTPLSDYINDSDERQAIIQEFGEKVNKILLGKGTKQEKNSKLLDLTGEYNTKIEKQNLKYLVEKGSTAAKMAQTGARGNPSQLATGTSTPLMSMNVKKEMIPLVIERSFAQGMRPAEHLALSYMGRGSTVATQLSTALPGALFKRLSPSVFHEVVTVDDCHTKNGILVPVSDTKSLIGRYTSDTNQMIDSAFLRSQRDSGVDKIKVRSVMTCEAKSGVCQHCFGLWANGKLPEIGTNVGVVAAQSVSEVLTQAMLSTKHKSTAGERKGNAYEQAANILKNPKVNFKDEATISNRNGVVTDIKQTSFGDHQVFVDGEPHFVPISQNVVVNKGDKIRMGDKLSTGTINPRKLVSLRGIGAGRDYMAKELREIYGGGLDPRHFEVISRNLLRYAEVQDPGHTGFLPGEKVDVASIQKHLEPTAEEVNLDKATNKVLAKGILNLTPGTYLDPNHIQDLKDSGIEKVYVTNSGLKVTPIVPGLETAKLLDSNWVSKLSFSHLRDTLKDSAAVGAESKVHSTDPITGYMFGNEFGEGPNGEY